MANLKMIEAAIDSLETADHETVARVAAEALGMIARRGRPAAEELFDALDSLSETDRGELVAWLSQWTANQEQGEEEEEVDESDD